MRGYVIAGSFAAGFSVVAILLYLAFRIFTKRFNKEKDTETLFISTRSEELNSSLSRERANSKDNEERVAKSRKKEKRKEVKSLWLPKKKDSLPMMTATMVQPIVAEQSKVGLGKKNMAYSITLLTTNPMMSTLAYKYM